MPKAKYHGDVTVPSNWDMVVVVFDTKDDETAGPKAGREIWLSLEQANALVTRIQAAMTKIERRALTRLRVPPDHYA